MSDWDAELKKIDRQLESMSDAALIPAPAKGAPPAAKEKVAEPAAAPHAEEAPLADEAIADFLLDIKIDDEE